MYNPQTRVPFDLSAYGPRHLVMIYQSSRIPTLGAWGLLQEANTAAELGESRPADRHAHHPPARRAAGLLPRLPAQRGEEPPE